MKSSVKLANLFRVQWLSAPPGLQMALLEDNPEQTDDMCWAYLSSEEKNAGRIKKNSRTRRSWLLGRLATKVAAGKVWPETEVEVITGPQGRPILGPGTPPRGQVSISHTSGAALAAVGETPVGVDLERANRPLNQGVLNFVFSPAELELIPADGGQFATGGHLEDGNACGTGGPLGAQSHLPTGGYPRALAMWCAREAAAKKWGLGLLNHLQQVRVTAADWPGGHLTVDWLGEGESGRAEVFLQLTGPWLTALALGDEVKFDK